MWIKVLLVFAVLSRMDSSLAERDPQMLRNAMEHLLQIRPPVHRTKRADVQSSDSSSPNLYMMELYKKYLTSESMKTRSNTIRSIIPQRGQVGGDEMLLFNLSGLSRNEEIGSVELHFYKRRAITPAGSRGKPTHQHHLLGYSVETDEQVGKWEVALDKRGWQVYDVTSAVTAVRQLGFMFQGVKRSSGRYEDLPLDSVMRMEPSPFLVVFSNERSNASLVTPHDLNALPESNDPVTQQRKKRSIDDNELPETDHYSSNIIPQTSPGMLQARGRKQQQQQQQQHYQPAVTKGTLPYPKSQSSELDGSTPLDWPEDKKKRTGSSSSGGRKGKRRNRKLPETWHYNQQQHVNDARLDVPDDAGRSLCQRRKLTVDFNEIGWGEWIISPKTFEAQYCAGRCPFPLSKELNPTNHATIQSIVHAIGGHPEVPAPCCVPDVLSSLTLLYFDDNRNVVLKNYPSMTAESCACR